jgi:molecular chaperone DnaK (HSP70)
VQILEGESASPEHCTSLAAAAIRNLPPGLKRGTKIEVSYRLEANGRLSVHARVPGAGDEANIELARVEGLEDETVSKWKKIICRDGGFSAFEDALMDFLDEGDLEASAQQPATRTTTLEPATEEGASQAASDALRKKLTR